MAVASHQFECGSVVQGLRQHMKAYGTTVPIGFQPLLSETEAAQTTKFHIEVPTTTVDGLVG
jgi:hypothetical protein